MKRALLPLFVAAAMCGSSAGATETITSSDLRPATSLHEAPKVGDAKLVPSQNVVEPDDVATVPEPMTWLMLILGLLGVGFIMRRPTPASTTRIRYL